MKVRCQTITDFPVEHAIVSQLTAFKGGESPQMVSAGTERTCSDFPELTPPGRDCNSLVPSTGCASHKSVALRGLKTSVAGSRILTGTFHCVDVRSLSFADDRDCCCRSDQSASIADRPALRDNPVYRAPIFGANTTCPLCASSRTVRSVGGSFGPNIIP